MNALRRETFSARHLDSGSRMGEILFGLIMTLTFTLGAGLVIEEEGRQGVRELLLATIGCNLAWGVIDGIFYVLGEVFERGRRQRLRSRVRDAASDIEAQSLIGDELDELLASTTDEAQRRSLYGAIVQRVRSQPIPPIRLRMADVMGGVVAGWLVFACSIPAVLPFLVLDNMRLALRVSNALLLILLFFVGHRFARDTMARPWVTGAVFLLVGLALVALTMALGG